jgi:preprotein translocase subunit SecB
MKISPLQLDALHLLKVAITCNEDVQGPVSDTDLPFKVTCNTARHDTEDRKWMVEVGFEVHTSDEHPSYYDIDIAVRGYFTVADSYPEDRAEILVAVNGPSLLFGSIRDIVYSSTLRFPHPALLLTSISFADEAEKIRKEREELDAREGVKQEIANSRDTP